MRRDRSRLHPLAPLQRRLGLESGPSGKLPASDGLGRCNPVAGAVTRLTSWLRVARLDAVGGRTPVPPETSAGTTGQQ